MPIERKKLVASLRPWLELLRVPNLFTVPGDPIAGAFIAFHTSALPIAGQGGRILACAVISICLYAAGLVLNDITDIDRDRVQRPERPLPRGVIRISAAWKAYWGLQIVALLAAMACGKKAFIVSVVIIVLVAVYTRFLKQNRLHGSISMGLCRGASFLLGASLADRSATVWICTCCVTCYIAAVTWIAWRENVRHRPGRIAWCPVFVFICLGLVRLPICIASPFRALLCLLFLAIAVKSIFVPSAKLAGASVPPAVIRAAIGSYLRALPFGQVALIVSAPLAGSVALSAVLLGLWGISRVLAVRISQS